MRIPIKRKDTVGSRIVDDCVGVFGRRNSREFLKCPRVKHDNRLIVCRCGEAVAALLSDRGALGSVHGRALAEKFSSIFINHHDAVRTTDEYAVLRRLRDDVVPAAVATESISLYDMVTGRRLCEEW